MLKALFHKMSLKHTVDVPVEKATFGMGCFWGVDSLFGGQVGVIATKVGYAGGKVEHPTYYKIADHTEVVQVDFDPKSISYEGLLKEFWKNHDPTQIFKTQYRSVILYHNEDQKIKAEKSKENYEQAAKKNVCTKIEQYDKFYDAEGYHQKYRLQQHSKLMKWLGFKKDDELLKTSHVAARSNAYVVGMTSVSQFEEEAPKLGFNKEIMDYVLEYVTRYQGRGMVC